MDFIFGRSAIGKLLDEATSEKISQDDWAPVLVLCERVAQEGHSGCETLVKEAKKNLRSKSSIIAENTVRALEGAVKNCGPVFQRCLAEKEHVDDLLKLIKDPKFSDGPKEKLLGFIQFLGLAFGNYLEFHTFVKAYDELKSEGYHFPQPDENALHSSFIQTQTYAAHARNQAQFRGPQVVYQPVHQNGVPHPFGIPVQPGQIPPGLPNQPPPQGVVRPNPAQLPVATPAEELSSASARLELFLSLMQSSDSSPELLQEFKTELMRYSNRIASLAASLDDDVMLSQLLQVNDAISDALRKFEDYLQVEQAKKLSAQETQATHNYGPTAGFGASSSSEPSSSRGNDLIDFA